MLVHKQPSFSYALQAAADIMWHRINEAVFEFGLQERQFDPSERQEFLGQLHPDTRTILVLAKYLKATIFILEKSDYKEQLVARQYGGGLELTIALVRIEKCYFTIKRGEASRKVLQSFDVEWVKRSQNMTHWSDEADIENYRVNTRNHLCYFKSDEPLPNSIADNSTFLTNGIFRDTLAKLNLSDEEDWEDVDMRDDVAINGEGVVRLE